MNKKPRFSLICILVSILLATPTSLSISAAENVTEFQFLNLGMNNNAASSKMLVKLKISGGNSTKATSCSSYFMQEGNRIQIGLIESGQGLQSFFWSGTSGNSAKTVSLDASSLVCEFYTTPAWSIKTDASKWAVQIVLSYDEKQVASQSVTLWNSNSAPPSISISSPARGSKITGELNIDFVSDDKGIWANQETFVYVVEGWEATCRGGGGSRANVSSRGQTGSSTVVKNNSVSDQVWPLIRVDATRTKENQVSVYIQNSGKYTVCIGQSYGSKFDPNPPDPNTGEISFADVGVPIDYVAASRNITLDINDVRFKRLGTPLANFLEANLVCPKSVKIASKSITCTLNSRVIPFSDYDVQRLGFPSGTNITLKSVLEYAICVKAEDWGHVACQNKNDLVPAYYAHIESVNINVGESVKVTVPNFLSKTGFTLIECGLICSGSEEYQSKDYKSPDNRAATATPSAIEQKRMIGLIRKGMNQTCQKLPKGFTSLQGKFIKRANSSNGLMGYVYSIGGKIYIQLYDLGSVYWRFGPSPTKEDNKNWNIWGCGTSAIEIYG